MELIPAIDIKDGSAVRLYQGDFAQVTVYDADPADAARRWEQQGATRIHLVDLDGARSGYPVHADVIGRIALAVSIPLQLGGGLRDEAAVRRALDLGVERAILGTAAVADRALVERLAAEFGDRIIVGVDARDGMVATAGWLEAAAVSATELVADLSRRGVRRFIYTDIARDGTLSSPNYAATAELIRPGGPAIIASGGVGTIDHLRQLVTIGCEGVVIGRALYTGAIDLASARSALTHKE